MIGGQIVTQEHLEQDTQSALLELHSTSVPDRVTRGAREHTNRFDPSLDFIDTMLSSPLLQVSRLRRAATNA